MRMSHIRYFLEISRTQNISLAAKNLHLSQPSLSFAVKSLEDELGISLLIRHSHSVSLTDAGEKFASHAERIIGSAEQLSDLMQRHSKLKAGNLRIGMLWIGGYMNLFSILNEFRKTSPEITYELIFDGSDVLLQKLMNRALHGVFVISSEAALSRENELYSIKISTEEYLLIVPKSNDLSKKNNLSIIDLSEQNIIMPSQKTLLHRQLAFRFSQEGIKPNILCTTSQPDIVSQLVNEGLGIGFASRTVAQKICHENCRLIEFNDNEKIYRTVYYVTLKELLDYPLTKTFTEYIKTARNLFIPDS